MVPLEKQAAVRPVRVLIADDVAQVRQDLRIALELAGGVDVVGEASDGRQAVDLAARLRPDVVLMDLEMPVLNGCEATRQVKARWPTCRIVALTVHGDEASRQKAFRAGIDDFIVKGAALESLLRAISNK